MRNFTFLTVLSVFINLLSAQNIFDPPVLEYQTPKYNLLQKMPVTNNRTDSVIVFAWKNGSSEEFEPVAKHIFEYDSIARMVGYNFLLKDMEFSNFNIYRTTSYKYDQQGRLDSRNQVSDLYDSFGDSNITYIQYEKNEYIDDTIRVYLTELIKGVPFRIKKRDYILNSNSSISEIIEYKKTDSVYELWTWVGYDYDSIGREVNYKTYRKDKYVIDEERTIYNDSLNSVEVYYYGNGKKKGVRRLIFDHNSKNNSTKVETVGINDNGVQDTIDRMFKDNIFYYYLNSDGSLKERHSYSNFSEKVEEKIIFYYSDKPLAISNKADPQTISVRNPIQNTIQVTGKGINTIEVFDTRGVQVLNKTFTNPQDYLEVDFSDKISGIYLARIQFETGKSWAGKILKE